MKKFFILLSIFYISVGIKTFGSAKEKIYFCHRLVKKPFLDGKVRNDSAWKNVSKATGFLKLGTTFLASKQTSFKIAYNGEGIYIGIECKEPEIEIVKANLKDMANLWNEDSIEIFILPKGTDDYYQFVINTIGSRWMGVGKYHPLRSLSLDWQAYTYKGKDYWSAEIKIPFEIFEKIPKKDEIWTATICRNIYTFGDKHSSWTHLEHGFHEPKNWGRIVFKDALLPEEVVRIEKKLIKRYLKKVKKLESVISNWKKEDFLFFKKIKKDLRSYFVEWKKAKKELSELNTLPPDKVHKLLEIVRKFPYLLQFRIDNLRGEYIRDSLFSEEK